MKLTVKNFGPIHKAEVDVKYPMTVFVGPSNTGKSYMAILIYTIAKAFERMDYRRVLSSLFDEEEFYEKKKIEEIISDDEKFAKLAHDLLLRFALILRAFWEDEALRCFGEEWGNLIRQKMRFGLGCDL